MPCSVTCACHAAPGIECLSLINPEKYSHFKSWCQLDESTESNRVKRQHVLNRSLIAFSSADELRKVLAPVAGGSGGCACICASILVQCMGVTGHFVSGSTMTIGSWSKTFTTLPTGGLFLSPAQYGPGTYTVVSSVPGYPSATDMITITYPGLCNTYQVPGVKGGPPTLDSITDATVARTAAFSKNFTGVGNGPGPSSVPYSVFASSSNPAIIPNPTVTYTSPNATGTLSIGAGILTTAGTAIITVTVTTSGGLACNINTFSQTFHLTVT